MLEIVAVLVLIGTVIWFSAASFSHFERNTPPSRGTLFVTAITPAGTIVNFMVWRRLSEPVTQNATLLALALGLLAAAILWSAQKSAPSRLLGRAFSALAKLAAGLAILVIGAAALLR